MDSANAEPTVNPLVSSRAVARVPLSARVARSDGRNDDSVLLWRHRLSISRPTDVRAQYLDKLATRSRHIPCHCYPSKRCH